VFRVNTRTGNLCLTVPDLFLRGLIPINLCHEYNSGVNYRGSLGLGWSHHYDLRLERRDVEIDFWRGGDRLFSTKAAKVGEKKLLPAYTIDRTEFGWTITSAGDRLRYNFDESPGVMRVRTASDRNGNRLDLSYTQDGRLRTLTDPFGRVLKFEYNGDDALIQIIISTGNESLLILQCVYDISGRLIRTIDRDEGSCTYAYDGERLVAFSNPLGGTCGAQYDLEGRCIRVWEISGSYSRELSYDPVGRATRVVDSEGNSTVYRFDENGFLDEKLEPLGGVWKYIHGSDGSFLSLLDPDGHAAVYHGSSDGGRELARIEPGGARTSFVVDDDGVLTGVTDAVGGKWLYGRDQRGNLSALTTPCGRHWTINRTERGQLETVEAPDGSVTRYRWAPDGRSQTLEDAFGLVESRQFDMLGRIVYLRDGRGAELTVRYEHLTHVLTNVDGTRQEYRFDACGNLVQFTNQLGYSWTFEVDAWSRLRKQIDPLGFSIELEYDPEGRIKTIVNENRDRFERARDPLGRVVRETNFDGGRREYKYDSRGRTTWKRDANGNVVTIERDPGGHTSRRTYSDGSVLLDEHDLLGRLSRAEGLFDAIARKYDADGRLQSEVVSGVEVRAEFGPWDAPTKVLGTDREVHYSYDPRGRLASVAEGDGLRLTATYDEADRRDTILTGSGLELVRQFDRRKRLVQQIVRIPLGQTLFVETFEYDAASNLIKRVRSGREPVDLRHTNRGELAEIRRGQQYLLQCAYDGAGNTLEINGRVRTYGRGNRLLASRVDTYQYDGEGRETRHQHDAGSTSFDYDCLGRLTGIHSAEARSVNFRYDPLFRRTRKQSDLGVEEIVWFRNVPWRQRLTDGRRLDYIFHPFDEALLAVAVDGEWHYAVTDWRGELTDLIRARDHALVWSSEPLGFRSQIIVNLVGFEISLGARGQIADEETTLIYHRARYYEPAECRFQSPDPLGVQGGWNLYRYCLNRPFLLIDPLGLTCASAAECNDIFNGIQNRQASIQQRWNEMESPTTILPWQGAPPVGQVYAAAAVSADGTAIPVGSISQGSVDTHLRNYDDEQRGLQREIQRYHENGCSAHEDTTRAEAMENAATWSTTPPSLPAYGLP
jgi:RHS repeat-associated protein